MRIGIFGGTFNPPHIGHIMAANAAYNELALDLLLFIPTSYPPHKPMPINSPLPEQRLHMLRLAATSMSDIIVSDLELERGGISYTSDTLTQLKKDYPNAEFWMLIGSDLLPSIPHWYRAESILSSTSLAVFARDYENNSALTEHTRFLRDNYSANTAIIPFQPIVISSSELRELLQNRQGLNFLSDEVYSYIIKNHFYASKPDFDWLRTKSYTMLNENRIPHVIGTEITAVLLAEHWNESTEEARTAAILHDATKRLSYEEQLILCEKYVTLADSSELQTDKLLHAKTGAALAYYEFGASEAVRDAICWHTTGKADMSMLEKILYIADYIEPNRDFDGVELLRELAYSDIDSALKLGLEMSLDDMRERGIEPHIRSTEALQFLYSKKDK